MHARPAGILGQAQIRSIDGGDALASKGRPDWRIVFAGLTN